mmetsp:Transcript_141596/g.452754  ORF Transcript_141596/g.452754 Transcript_141596/m.452754 type:complete len:259 (-) Transcript_141596:1254-2030(-)
MLAEEAVDIHDLRLALSPLVEVEDPVQHRGDDHGANLDDHVVKALDRAGDDVHNLRRRLHHVQSVADAPVAPLRKLIGEARHVPHERDLLRSEARRSHVLVGFVEVLLLLAVAQELQHRLRRLRRCLVHGRVGGLKGCLEALHCHLGLEAGLLGLVQARVLQGEVHDETQGRAHHAVPELAAAIISVWHTSRPKTRAITIPVGVPACRRSATPASSADTPSPWPSFQCRLCCSGPPPTEGTWRPTQLGGSPTSRAPTF